MTPLMNSQNEMKRFSVVLVVMMLCTSGVAWGYNGWGLFAAYWDAKDADEGYGAGLKISAEMVEGVQLELRGTFFNDLEDEADAEVIPLEVGLALSHAASETVDIYGGGGFGYHLVDADEGDPDDEVGFYLVAGADWNLKEMASLFGEILYRDVDIDVGPSDVDLSGVGVNLGVLIKW